MQTKVRELAVVTGASTGIGFELARLCAKANYDVIIAADEPVIGEAAADLAATGALVIPVQCDLSTADGVSDLIAEIDRTGRPVQALLANAGRGLGKAFLDQDIDEALKVVHTNLDGTLRLLHDVGRGMRNRGRGRILITGSIAGAGTFQAVYNGTKAFLDSFSVALSNELKETGVTVTCLLPNTLDTKVGTEEKMDAAEVAKIGFDAMMRGEVSVVAGFANKIRAAAAHVVPDSVLAKMHRKQAAPGTAKQ